MARHCTRLVTGLCSGAWFWYTYSWTSCAAPESKAFSQSCHAAPAGLLHKLANVDYSLQATLHCLSALV